MIKNILIMGMLSIYCLEYLDAEDEEGKGEEEP